MPFLTRSSMTILKAVRLLSLVSEAISCPRAPLIDMAQLSIIGLVMAVTTISPKKGMAWFFRRACCLI